MARRFDVSRTSLSSENKTMIYCIYIEEMKEIYEIESSNLEQDQKFKKSSHARIVIQHSVVCCFKCDLCDSN